MFKFYLFFGNITKPLTFAARLMQGELAQLARALAWHARGHRFDSGILHHNQPPSGGFLFSIYNHNPKPS